MTTEPVQHNAARADQVRRGNDAQKERARRRRYLMNRLLTGQLTAAEGREFACDVMLGDVGVFRLIDLSTSTQDLAARVALNNLGVKWVREIATFPQLYRQMQEEAEKRAESAQQARAAMNAAPTTEDTE